MDIEAKVTRDEMGYIVEAYIGESRYHVTVMHPELEKAWETISSYVIREMNAVEEGK